MSYSRSDKSSDAVRRIADINYPPIRAGFYTTFLRFYTLAQTGASLLLTDEQQQQPPRQRRREGAMLASQNIQLASALDVTMLMSQNIQLASALDVTRQC